MDKDKAALIFQFGRIVEENSGKDRSYPASISGRWLYPGEVVIEHEGTRYVCSFPEAVVRKDL